MYHLSTKQSLRQFTTYVILSLTKVRHKENSLVINILMHPHLQLHDLCPHTFSS